MFKGIDFSGSGAKATVPLDVVLFAVYSVLNIVLLFFISLPTVLLSILIIVFMVELLLLIGLLFGMSSALLRLMSAERLVELLKLGVFVLVMN